jgi:oligopeptidase B
MKSYKLKKLYQERNLTKKSYKYFKDNLTRYLTPDELSSFEKRNDLLHYINSKGVNTKYKHIMRELKGYNQHYYKHKSNISEMAEKIRSYFKSYEFVYSEDSSFLIKGKYNKKSSYLQLTVTNQCNTYDILNLDQLGKKFPFFQVSKIEISPSNEKILLSIDFIGSQVYHLFIKNLFSNEIHEIKIPNQTMRPTHEVFGDTNSTQEAIWLDDTRISYVSIDRYYNDSGVYLYDLTTRKHRLLYKCKHGYFISLNSVESGLYILMIVSNYHSDEVFIIDSDSYFVRKKPLFKRQFSVRYPYLNHINGQWVIQRQDKEVDEICISRDLVQYKVLYRNTNPYEQIIELDYSNDTFLFTLSTFKSLQLFLLKCNKLTLLQESDTDYFSLEGFNHNEYKIYRHKYSCPYKEQIVSIDNSSITSVTMNPKYTEKEIYIRNHLRVTIIYKKTPTKNSRCLLRGYGAYNTYEHAEYSSYYFPLLEEGFVIAIAHLRGGGEYGYKGYDEGRFNHKKNTFIDFIDTANYLIQNEYTSNNKLAIWGRSCGGLLITSVLNIQPDLCKVALIGVPFVTPIDTMKTYKTPLGIETQSELGDPHKKNMKQYIHSYAPLEHINPKGDYPNMFIYTNLNDSLVPYIEPLQYYNSMKNLEIYTSGKKDISFYIDFRFGHKQGTLLKDRSEHYAILFTYLLKYL